MTEQHRYRRRKTGDQIADLYKDSKKVMGIKIG